MPPFIEQDLIETKNIFNYFVAVFNMNATCTTELYDMRINLAICTNITAVTQVNYTKVKGVCHTVRNHADIDDSWDELAAIIETYGTNHYHFAEEAGPGFFNDPDMVSGSLYIRHIRVKYPHIISPGTL